MAPARSTAMSIGTANEKNVIRALPDFFKLHGKSIVVVNDEILECGLLCHKEFPFISTSPDGICKITTGDDAMHRFAIIEIKTATNDDTEEVEHNNLLNSKAFTVCSTHEQFRTLVKNVEHRAQLLHHAATTSTAEVIYVYASTTSIVRVILMKFSKLDILNYMEMLNALYRKYLYWIYDRGARVTEALMGVTNFGHAKNLETIMQHYYIWLAYSEYATNYIDPVSGRKIPPPCCRLFIPVLNGFWNKIKGGNNHAFQVLNNIDVV